MENMWKTTNKLNKIQKIKNSLEKENRKGNYKEEQDNPVRFNIVWRGVPRLNISGNEQQTRKRRIKARSTPYLHTNTLHE